MKYWSIIILCAGIVPNKAQNLLPMVNLEKQIFQCKDSVQYAMLVMDKSRLYKTTGDYRTAIMELERLDKYKLPSLQREQWLYEKALDYYLNENNFGALSVYNTLKDEFPIQTENETLLGALVLNENEKWEKCKTLLDNRSGSAVTDFQKLPVHYKYLNPYTARTLSTLLPGGGQVYAGHPFRGITSLILNTGFAAFTVYNISTGFYITAFNMGLLPFNKFYRGGIIYSERLVLERNEKEKAKIKALYRAAIFASFK